MAEGWGFEDFEKKLGGSTVREAAQDSADGKDPVAQKASIGRASTLAFSFTGLALLCALVTANGMILLAALLPPISKNLANE